jgi:hypothetical protein
MVVLWWGLNGGSAEEARGRHARLETSGLYLLSDKEVTTTLLLRSNLTAIVLPGYRPVAAPCLP